MLWKVTAQKLKVSEEAAPKAVVLKHSEGQVEVRDASSAELLFCTTIRRVAGWLATCGYAYSVGTNGVWVRS